MGCIGRGVLAAALVFATAGAALADDLVGRASVIDGDTIEIHGIRIRLFGIDAPESRQLCTDRSGQQYRCGQVAALALADRIGQRTVHCEPRDTDRYGRTVAICSAGGENLNGWLVAQGHAVAYRRYGGKIFDTEETEARAAGRGVWQGEFQLPWEWRREHKRGGR
jgi:endonuclease YncB( thermonuclease family)